jgi:hypothetical protein
VYSGPRYHTILIKQKNCEHINREASMTNVAVALAVAAILLGGATCAQAGPASPDAGETTGVPGQPPAFATENQMSGGNLIGAPGGVPSFGAQNPQGAGLMAKTPEDAPSIDDLSSPSGDTGKKD